MGCGMSPVEMYEPVTWDTRLPPIEGPFSGALLRVLVVPAKSNGRNSAREADGLEYDGGKTVQDGSVACLLDF